MALLSNPNRVVSNAAGDNYPTAYVNLLVKQYWDKPKARAEIKAMAEFYYPLHVAMKRILEAFDVDTAVGDQLSKIVGMPRTARAELIDEEFYRLFVKIKIAKNNFNPAMIGNSSIQDLIAFALSNQAYVLDGYDMTLTLYAFSGVDPAQIALMRELDLLPKPGGVGYKLVALPVGDVFGFAEDPGASGFEVGGFADYI